MTTLLSDLLDEYREDPAMSEILKEYYRESLPRLLARIPVEERLKGVSAEDRLAGVPVAERLAGVPAAERLKNLTVDELLEALPPEGREALRQRLVAEAGKAP